MLRLRWFGGALALALLALAAGRAQSTTIVLQSLEASCEEAQRITHGRVVSANVERADDGDIYTTYQLDVLESLKGGERTLILRQLGGQLGIEGTRAPGVPHFEVGEEVLVFSRSRQDGTATVLNVWQGCMRVRLDDRGVRHAPAARRLFSELERGELSAVKVRIRTAMLGQAARP